MGAGGSLMETMVTAPPALPPPSGRPPEINLAPRDVEALADELVAYQALFAPLFQRAEQRHWALLYLQGQMLDLERKSIEPMALALEGGDVQAMQQFISQGAWDAEAVLQRHQELVAQTLGDADTGVLIVDGCDFAKQGTHSVGVARQWCGALGKVATCQASVVAGYASARGYTLVDRRLYLPERWFTAEYATRRQRCGVPPPWRWARWPRCCRPRPGRASRSKRGPRGRWRRSSRSCGRSPCATDGRDQRSGWCCGAVWTRRPSSRPTCPTPRPTRPRQRWCGCAGCAGRRRAPLRKARARSAWTTTRCAAGWAGTITSP